MKDYKDFEETNLPEDAVCFYCGTTCNNATTRKDYKVCTCYRLQSNCGVVTQYYANGYDKIYHQAIKENQSLKQELQGTKNQMSELVKDLCKIIGLTLNIFKEQEDCQHIFANSVIKNELKELKDKYVCD